MKVFKQLLKEFWIPLLFALTWASYNFFFGSNQDEKLIKFAQNFGAAFFLSSWFGGQILRVIKQQKTESSFSNIISRLLNVSENLEKVSEDLEGYSTGGDAYCIFGINIIDTGGFFMILAHRGKYPIHDLEITLRNHRNDEHSNVGNRPSYKLGALGIGAYYLFEPGNSKGIFLEENTEKDLMYSALFSTRKGGMEQHIRMKLYEDKWYIATRLVGFNKVLYTKGLEEFPLNDPFPRDIYDRP